MRRFIVVPYDGSPVARAVLRRAAAAAATPHLYRGLLIATVGLEPADLDDAIAYAARIAGPALPIDVAWLRPTEPINALRELLEDGACMTLAAPLRGRGRAPWYAEACRTSDVAAKTMIFFLTPREMREAEYAAPAVRGRLAAMRRALHRSIPRRWTAAHGLSGGNEPVSPLNPLRHHAHSAEDAHPSWGPFDTAVQGFPHGPAMDISQREQR